MFSGLIAYQGTVRGVIPQRDGGVRLTIACERGVTDGASVKDSVAINGVCLTVVERSQQELAFDVVPETLSRSTLGSLAGGDHVNLELSLRVGDRVGGHFVYGHVDAAVRVLERRPEGQGERVRIECPPSLDRFICEKAFVSVDGVSVTVARIGGGAFELALIPETLRRTTLGERKAGQFVNLEVDPLARYAVAAVDGHSDEHSRAELEWAFEI
ncbi:MAG: riboflavin synthase [Vulcanimicrobiaceae bacterium]